MSRKLDVQVSPLHTPVWVVQRQQSNVLQSRVFAYPLKEGVGLQPDYSSSVRRINRCMKRFMEARHRLNTAKRTARGFKRYPVCVHIFTHTVI